MPEQYKYNHEAWLSQTFEEVEREVEASGCNWQRTWFRTNRESIKRLMEERQSNG